MNEFDPVEKRLEDLLALLCKNSVLLSEQNLCWFIANVGKRALKKTAIKCLLNRGLLDLETSTLVCLMRWGDDKVRHTIWPVLIQRRDFRKHESVLFEYLGDWIDNWSENFLKAVRRSGLC